MSDKEKSLSLRDEVNGLVGSVPMMGSEPNAPIDPMERPLWEVDEDLLNPYKPLPDIVTWCKIGGRPALPKQGIVTFSAKQKKGKSLSTYAFAIPLLSGRKFDTIEPLETPNMIMVFDMEMSETTLTQRALNQVKAIGENGQRFLICPLKGLPIETMIERIEAKIEKYNPHIIVLDQAGKLILDTNDTKTSNTLTNLLDNWSKERAVWVVMHENKTAGDTNMRGHFGSYLSFAAVEAYAINKKNGIFTATFKEGRDTEADGAATVNFILDSETKAITDATAAMEQSKETEADEWREYFGPVFGQSRELGRSELVRRIKSHYGIKSDTTADAKVSQAKVVGALAQSGERKPYYINRPGVDFETLDLDDDL